MARRSSDPPISGVLLIDKPTGSTSHDVVGRVRWILGMRRVGHAGTLDPMATGVLVVGLGPATRLLGIVGGHDKAYSATIRLGAATTTDDREGEVTTQAPRESLSAIADDDIARARNAFVGHIRQRPSAVSAVKVGGKRAYQRVRDGEDVELPQREVNIAAFDIQGTDRHDGFIDIRVHVECSAGTYIRALARDLGDALGVGGHLTELRRTRSGAVTVEECVPLEDVVPESVRPAAWLARRELPSIDIEAESVLVARNGGRLPQMESIEGLRALIGPNEDLVAVIEPSGAYRVVFPAVNS